MSYDVQHGSAERVRRPITTRKSFIVLTGFSVISLYFLWAAYGAAPLNILGTLEAAAIEEANTAAMAKMEKTAAGAEKTAAGGAMAGMNMSGAGSAIDDFVSLTDAFIAKYQLPDGSVRPLAPQMNMAMMATDKTAPASDMKPIAEVLLSGFQWGYDPSVIRLTVDQPYKFRMMALDATHGASISTGTASRMIRLRPGVENVQILTFSKPGKYLIYCTVYCGQGHQFMQAQIIVEPPTA